MNTKVTGRETTGEARFAITGRHTDDQCERPWGAG